MYGSPFQILKLCVILLRLGQRLFQYGRRSCRDRIIIFSVIGSLTDFTSDRCWPSLALKWTWTAQRLRLLPLSWSIACVTRTVEKNVFGIMELSISATLQAYQGTWELQDHFDQKATMTFFEPGTVRIKYFNLYFCSLYNSVMVNARPRSQTLHTEVTITTQHISPQYA